MIKLNEFISRIDAPGAEGYAMICGEIVVFDRTEQVVYIPITTYGNARLNPMGDFRTIIGNGLLWSRHIEVDCSSAEMANAVREYVAEPYIATCEYEIYKLNTALKRA